MRALIILALLGAAACAPREEGAMWSGPAGGGQHPVRAATSPWVPPRQSVDATALPERQRELPPRPRRGSSTPPDLLREPVTEPSAPRAEIARPQLTQPQPYQSQGQNYQRHGDMYLTPEGTARRVGPTIFGTGGQLCNEVAGQLMCR